MGRVITCTYPDRSSIHKTYNPISLCKIERIKEGSVIYVTTLENFDLSRIPNTIHFPNKNGTLSLEYDLMNRLIQICYPQYQEKGITYDARGLLTEKTVDGSLHRFEHDHLMQLTLEQTSAYTHTYQNDPLNRQIQSME